MTTTQPTPSIVPVFFLLDSGGDGVRPGPFLVAAGRNCFSIEWAVSGVLDGTTVAEDDGDLITSIPAFRTRLNSVSVANGVAVVDLSSEFPAGADSATMRLRLAQLVFTVTAFDSAIERVRVLVDGTPLEALPDGTSLDDPLTRATFYDRLPGILIESPTWEGWTRPPLIVRGIAAVTNGDFTIEVLGSSGDVYATATVVTDNPNGWGAFEVTFASSEDWSTPQTIWLHVYDTRADGTITSERTQPASLRLNP